MRTRNQPQGVSVIEVMIALGIAVIIVISVGSLIISTHNLDIEASKQLRAVSFAKEWLEVADVNRNAYFGCTCGSSPACQLTPVRQAAGYTSCWSQAIGTTGNTGPFQLVPSGSTWTFQGGTNTLADGFTRTLQILNQQRDANGAIVSTGGVEDPNTKLVTVTVQWQRAGATRQAQFSKIVTAWKNF